MLQLSRLLSRTLVSTICESKWNSTKPEGAKYMRPKVIRFAKTVAAVLCGLGLFTTLMVVATRAGAGSAGTGKNRIIEQVPHVSHVLFISVDGLHQSDLAWYVQQHPESTLAAL